MGRRRCGVSCQEFEVGCLTSSRAANKYSFGLAYPALVEHRDGESFSREEASKPHQTCTIRPSRTVQEQNSGGRARLIGKNDCARLDHAFTFEPKLFLLNADSRATDPGRDS
jgi:hypothetical protein